MNLGGGTHHAGRDFARGYCLFNDVAVALRVLRAEGLAERALVVDCDVHQGDGTAAPARPRPARVHALAARRAQLPVPADPVRPRRRPRQRHGRRGATCEALDEALDFALPRAQADIAFYLAGADPWEGDRLGRLALTKAGLRARDELVLDRLRGAGARVCVVLAGGYADDVRDTVDINAATAAAVARRSPTLIVRLPGA